MGNSVVAEESKTPAKTIHVYVSVDIEFDVPVPKGNYDCAWLLAESQRRYRALKTEGKRKHITALKSTDQ